MQYDADILMIFYAMSHTLVLYSLLYKVELVGLCALCRVLNLKFVFVHYAGAR